MVRLTCDFASRAKQLMTLSTALFWTVRHHDATTQQVLSAPAGKPR
jgi:hypothetical protein